MVMIVTPEHWNTETNVALWHWIITHNCRHSTALARDDA